MSNKEVLELMIMGKKISIACPPKDKEGLIKAAEILNEQIDSIHGPIGIKLGGKSASEIALSIISQLVLITNNR